MKQNLVKFLTPAFVLEGGKDRDQFVFRALPDQGDRIQDFTSEDVIDLLQIRKRQVEAEAKIRKHQDGNSSYKSVLMMNSTIA